MDYRVVWTPGADENLEDIAEYIHRDSPYYASVVVAKIRTEARKLKRYPFRGRIMPEAGLETVREIFVYNYRLIYEISGDKVVIMMIVHSARDLGEVELPKQDG